MVIIMSTSFYNRRKINVLFSKNMDFIKRLCGFNKNDEKEYEKKMIKSNTIHFHELKCAKAEDVKHFTIVTDVNGNTIVKPYSFVYLGYPFVESDTG